MRSVSELQSVQPSKVAGLLGNTENLSTRCCGRPVATRFLSRTNWPRYSVVAVWPELPRILMLETSDTWESAVHVSPVAATPAWRVGKARTDRPAHAHQPARSSVAHVGGHPGLPLLHRVGTLGRLAARANRTAGHRPEREGQPASPETGGHRKHGSIQLAAGDVPRFLWLRG